MAQSSVFSSIVKWIAGILASVITAVLIWWITKPKPAPPPPPAAIVVAGRVFDVSSNKLLPGVTVTLTAGTFSSEQPTDSEGRFGFKLDSVDPTNIATLKIAAAGYTPNPFVEEEPLGQMSNSDGDEGLTAVPAAPAPGGGSQNAGGSAPQPPGNLRIPINAVRTVVANPNGGTNNGQAATPAKLPPYVQRLDLAKIGTANAR